MAKAERPDRPLPDADARRAIREELGTSLLVEAAAGTGKTTSLVERMTSLIRTGATTVDRISAVTFTIKAAAELSERFQTELEGTARAARGKEKERCAAALARLDSAFVGTIHAFCARLLRERPVEAGVDPGFAEMDEPENAAARLEAWERYTERLFTDESPILPRLAALNVRLEDLRQTYETLSDNEDVAPAIGTETPTPDFVAERAAVAAFLERAGADVPAEMPAGGWTEYQEALRRAARLTALRPAGDAAAFAQVLDALHRARKKPAEAGRLRLDYERLCRDVLEPGLARWRRSLHPVLMRAVAPAAVEYAEWRRRHGRLNFQDLLLIARDLLRDHPQVRRAFQDRFLPILVDEFQDTDPIQAEILFYLTGEDADEKDWRALVPKAGSLFVVGDPKQSIYRFRRADIETYGAVRDRFVRHGRILRLSANFRSSGRLCGWVNGVFAGLFPAEATPQQAGWVALDPQRPDGAPGVFRLLVRTPGAGVQAIVDQDATRVARAIEAMVRGGRLPGDFLVLFRTRRFMSDYARELEARGIPYELSGGGAFRDSEELTTLLPLLSAISDPDDPVAFTAVLRGPLFGVDDEALYRHSRAGGRFTFRAALPDSPDPRIAAACALLTEGEALARELPPGAAISRLCARLGWTAYAAARELGDSRAGNLLKAIAAARTLSAEGLDFDGVVAELERLTSAGYIEEMSLRPGRQGAVRLMTAHGAKGLEAPVVFLADPRRENDPPVRFFIDRRGARPLGHWRVIRKSDEGFGVVEYAEPPDWETMEAAEAEFESAERIRLLYVAATRAKEMLVVSIWKQGRSDNAQGAWSALAPFLAEELPEPGPLAQRPVPPPLEGLGASLAAFRAEVGGRASAARPTSAVVTVTAVAHAGEKPAWESSGRGMSWGRVLHGMLEAAMRDPGLDLSLHGANLLAAEERPPGELPEVLAAVRGVLASPLWKRALAADRRLTEVPFALPVDPAELGLPGEPRAVVLQGAIDLAFEESGAWTLVDYKSDTVTPENRSALEAFYAPQIRLYRRYWERLTRQPTRAALYFLHTGELVALPAESMPTSHTP